MEIPILQPTGCNLCGAPVIYTSNSLIYGKEYGSGKMYYCTGCGAYVGTHKPRPKEALGILGNKQMRMEKMKCHELFDKLWKDKPTIKERKTARKEAYRYLAERLNIPKECCHFGYFDLPLLEKAYKVLLEDNAV